MSDLIEALGYETDAIRAWLDGFELAHYDEAGVVVMNAEDRAQVKLRLRKLDEISRRLEAARQQIIV